MIALAPLLSILGALIADRREPPAPDDLTHLLLLPPNEHPSIGPVETGTPVANGIAVYVSPGGFVRYVMFVKSTPIGALLVFTPDKRQAFVSQVYVDPDVRRNKVATLLVERARKDYRIVDDSAILGYKPNRPPYTEARIAFEKTLFPSEDDQELDKPLLEVFPTGPSILEEADESIKIEE